MIGFYWDKDGQWHYQTDINAEITIPVSDGAAQVIDNICPSDATTVVGVTQAADGNMTEQVRKLKEATNDVGDQINKGYLPPMLASMANS
jgi:phage-related tail fiber protein